MERLLSIYVSLALIATPSSCKPSSESLVGGNQRLGVRSDPPCEISGGSWSSGPINDGDRAFGYRGYTLVNTPTEWVSKEAVRLTIGENSDPITFTGSCDIFVVDQWNHWSCPDDQTCTDLTSDDISSDICTDQQNVVSGTHNCFAHASHHAWCGKDSNGNAAVAECDQVWGVIHKVEVRDSSLVYEYQKWTMIVMAEPADAATGNSWKLVMKIAEDETFGYSSSYWEDDALLNENSPVDERVNAKYQAFLNVPFSTIRMCVESRNSNCVTHSFNREWSSAKDLFSAGRIKDTTLDQANILSAFNPTPGDYQDCGMQNPGFNMVCRDNNKARWGYCVNCASQSCQLDDNNDADAAIGIGLSGQNTSPEMGAGWTEYFADGPGQCRAQSKTHKFVWLSIEGEETTEEEETPTGVCVDLDKPSKCQFWKTFGYCAPDFPKTRISCQKTCGLCGN